MLNDVPSERRLGVSPLEAHALHYAATVAFVTELVAADRLVVFDRALLSSEQHDRWAGLGFSPESQPDSSDPTAGLTGEALELVLGLVELHCLGPYERLRTACTPATASATTVLEI